MKCALITAGGCGTRLYPLSTKDCPKQFVKMFGEKTLIQLTYERINKFIDKENIFIVLPEKYHHFINELLPEVDETNIIIEPEQRSTAPCVLYSCLYIKKLRGNCTLGIFPADHYIDGDELFIKDLDDAYTYVSKNNSIVLFGIKPTDALDRYGYLKCGKSNKLINNIVEFKEKPDKETAIEYFNSDNYFWSSDISCFKVDYMLDQYKKYLPYDYELLERATAYDNNLYEAYSKCNKESTACAIYEKLDTIKMIKCNFNWDDVGVFDSLLKYTNNQNVIDAYNNRDN